jgi:beta-galactosidase
MRKTLIDSDWRFALGDFPAAIQAEFDDTGWRQLDLPHDWSIEGTPDPAHPSRAAGGFFPGGLGWYRKRLDVPADRRVFIEFDGVYRNSEVWCNGHFCGRRPYGYSSFEYELTPYLVAGGPNVVAVRVDNSRQPNSRWYSGSGIYRHVWLTVTGPVRVAHWGTFVTATPEAVECAVTVDGDAAEIVASIVEKPECGVRNAENGRVRFERPGLKLWSPDEPNLYTLRVELRRGAEVLDRYDTRFGVRTIRFDANEGFFLNGRSVKLQGVNEHHDAGCLGAAVPEAVWRRRLRILKAMGCNAIRTAHNPAAPALLDVCDEMGFMVIEEAFDEWRDGKTPFGYQLDWDEWWERDLADMIRRDRNHPCIVLWSVGNEIKEVRQGRPEGLPIMKALREVCHREDPTRPMTCGCCNSRETLKAGYGPLMDVFGYNGGGGGCFDYEKDHANYPGMPMLATEHPHTLQTRGVYRTRTWYRDLARNPNVERMEIPHLTAEEVFTGFDEHYQSSYGNAVVRMSIFDSWRRTKSLPYFCGEFRWTGFDYLGECYGWPAKSWNFGIIDLAGFPKDAYYFYQSQWTTAPTVHVLPHWTWPGMEGKTIPVITYSNCDRVELFLNNESLGCGWRWDVPYQPGTLRAVAYRGEKVVATCVHETAGAPVALRLSGEQDGDIAHVTVDVVDAQGRFVPHANPDITIEVTGPARLLGLENGDPLDTTNYKLNHRRAFHGKLLAIVQGNDFTLTAHAPGLSAVSAESRGGKDLPIAAELFAVGDRPAFLIRPAVPAAGRPWVWYAPTFLPGYPRHEERWMFERFLAAGLAIAGVDVGESYGSPAGREIYSALYRELTEQRGLSKRACLLARSRGGLMLYNWAAEHPESVACIAGIYPVGNLRSYPGLAKACGAYGLTETELAHALAAHNPIDRLAPLAKARIPIFHLHGDRDDVVPLEQNSGLLATRYQQLGGDITLEVVEGGGHDLSPGWFRNEHLVAFVIGHATG